MLSDPQAARARELWVRWLAGRDTEVRNELIELYLPWCRDVARSLFLRRGGLAAEFGEYLQMATVAMIECVDPYDPGVGVPFEIFALPRVRGRVLDRLRELSDKHEQVSLMARLRRQRAQALREAVLDGPADPFERLAQLTVGLAVGYMLEGTNLYRDERAERSSRAPYDSIELTQRRDTLSRLVLRLPDQERRVVRYHYFHGLPLIEVAELLGLSKGRISQIHARALMRLRDMTANKLIDFVL